jgi:hypothetical protein
MPDAAGKTATLRGRVWTDATLQARLRLDWDGSNFENGDYHGGDSEWERLSASATIPTTATQVKAILEVSESDTAYFDHVYLLIDPVYKYILSTKLIGWPNHVTMQYDEASVDGLYYPLKPGTAPIGGRILRTEGMGLLTQPSTDTEAIEIGEPHIDLVVAYAEMLFWRAMASPARSSQTQRQGFLDASQDSANEVELSARRLRMTRLGASRLDGVAHFEEDASGRYIVFDRNRQAVAI